MCTVKRWWLRLSSPCHLCSRFDWHYLYTLSVCMPYMYCTFNDDKAIRNHFQCDLRLNAWLQDSQEECKIHIILLLLLLSILLYIDECLHVDNSAWYYRYTYRHRDCFIFCVLTLSVRLEFLAFLFKKKTKKKKKIVYDSFNFNYTSLNYWNFCSIFRNIFCLSNSIFIGIYHCAAAEKYGRKANKINLTCVIY